MRIGQRGKFIGGKWYDGELDGGELFTVTELIEYFPDEKNWLFNVKLDTGEVESLLSEYVQMLTEEDDLKTLKILIDKYPEQTKEYLEGRNK